MRSYFPTFDKAIKYAGDALIVSGDDVDAGKWQGIKTEAHPSLITKEILNLNLAVPLDRIGSGNPYYLLEMLAKEIQPNREWADEHFEERVGGQPLNPDPSHERWPWWKGQDAETKEDGKFTHTYSERFWPKNAGEYTFRDDYGVAHEGVHPTHKGIRYDYGDLDDVIELLRSEPQGRQAYLPIFFPEDTGAVHGGRIPCTLGYHFLLRNDQFHMWYDIRSCDAVRHFRDDIYLAIRLQLWVLDALRAHERFPREQEVKLWDKVRPGNLFFCAHSFHVHMGDIHILYQEQTQ